MRVSMLVRCLAMMRGGGETRHLAWARELAALGVEVEIVTGAPLLGRPRYPVGELKVTMLRTPYLRDFVYRFQRRRGFGRLTMTALHLDEEVFCRAAWRHIRASAPKPDVVHAHALHQAARTRTADVPVVINLPGPPHSRYTADLRLADALVADGWAAQHLPAALGRPIERVPQGIEPQLFHPEGRRVREALRLQQTHLVITVARLVPVKNVRLLLDAAAIVRDHLPQLHVLIVGDGPESAALKQHAAALDLSDRVTFAGQVPQRDTPIFYRSADVFALSSDFDNSPNAVLEAMACGLPIVATDVGGVRQILRNGEGGIVVRPGDAAALAAAIERFLTSPDAARAAGLHNRARVVAEFSWRASAERLLEVYRRVAA